MRSWDLDDDLLTMRLDRRFAAALLATDDAEVILDPSLPTRDEIHLALDRIFASDAASRAS